MAINLSSPLSLKTIVKILNLLSGRFGICGLLVGGAASLYLVPSPPSHAAGQSVGGWSHASLYLVPSPPSHAPGQSVGGWSHASLYLVLSSPIHAAGQPSLYLFSVVILL